MSRTPTTEKMEELEEKELEIYARLERIEESGLIDDNEEDEEEDEEFKEEERMETLKREFGYLFEERVEDHSRVDGCYYCINRLIMEIEDVRDYIEMNKNKRSKNKKIKMIYRLMPYFFEEKMEGVEKVEINNYETYCYRYDTYFRSEEREARGEMMVQCDLCYRRVCEKHLEYVPFTFIKMDEKTTKCVCRCCELNYSSKIIFKNLIRRQK